MLHCPSLSPFSASSMLLGGILKVPNVVAEAIILSFRLATF